jgi:hypothetical protein
MLAIVYLTLTAGALSLRRLLLLFIFALMVANLVFAVFHVKDGPHAALVTAAAIALLAWSMPLARLAYGAIRLHMFMPNALFPASGFILWTYGFALFLFPAVAAEVSVAPPHRLTLALLLRGVALACAVGIGFSVMVRAIRPTRSVTRLSLSSSAVLRLARERKLATEPEPLLRLNGPAPGPNPDRRLAR